MKTKLKLLFLAILGLILIPTTNAYELGNQNFWSESWAPPTTTRHRGMCLYYNRDWYMTFDGKGYSYADISRDNTSCSEWAVLGNFFAPRDYNSPWYEQIYNDYFSYVNSKQNGEWMDMIRTVYQNGEHKTVITTLPSRTAYKRTSNAGIDYMFTQIYFYHNQFILYDPIKEVGLSFLGKMNVVGGAVFANPGTTEDNLRFVDYVRKKAYSATITNTAAWKWLLGTDVSMSRLQSTNWTKSYTMNKGGSSFLPPNFKIDKQGSEWFQYIEEIEFVSPDWNAGKPSNNWTGNQVAQNYRACVARRSDIKILAQISKTCGDDPADEEALNWVKVDSRNWEGDVKTILDQLTGKNKTKCGRYANIKKKYHDKYSKEWESFSKNFNNYAFTPEAIDVQAQCRWEELEQEHWSANNKVEWGFFQWIKNWFEWMRDKFRGYSWEPIGVYSGKNYYELDFNSDLAQLKIYQERCKSFWSLLGYVVWFDTVENERKRYCDKFEKKKKEMETIYWSFSWYNGLSGTYYSLSGNFDDLGWWNNFVKIITDPFYSWYNAYDLLPPLCSVKSDGVFDIVFYVFFACVVFYVFRLFV